MNQIKVNITYTAADLQQAYMLHFKKKQPLKSRRNLFIGCALLGIGGIAYYLDVFNGELGWVYWFCMSYGLIMILVYYFRLFTIGKRYFKKMPDTKTFPYEFSPEGLSFQAASSSKVIKWGVFQSAIITDKMVLLYSNELKFNIFPRKSFTDAQFELFTQWIRQNIANWM